MRILIVSYRYPPAARASNLVRSMAEALAGLGHSVTVLTKMPTEYLPESVKQARGANFPRREVVGDVEIVRVRGWGGMRSSIPARALEQTLGALAFTQAALRLPRPDIILTMSPPLPIALVGTLCSWLRRVPYVLNLQDIYPKSAVEMGLLRNPSVIWAMERASRVLYRFAREIVVPMEGNVRYLRDEVGLPNSKIRLLHNWVDVSRRRPGDLNNGFRQEFGLSGGVVVSYAGLLGFAQDLSTVIECARRLAARSDIRFILIGDGVLAERWKREAADLENVCFLPPVTEDRYYEALRASDVCLVPLSADYRAPAIPGKIQCIMAVARPILAILPEGDAAAMIRDSGCGYVVAPGDVEEMETRLLELVGDEALRLELGARGRAYAEAHFSLEEAAIAYEETLRRAACAERKGATLENHSREEHHRIQRSS